VIFSCLPAGGGAAAAVAELHHGIVAFFPPSSIFMLRGGAAGGQFHKFWISDNSSLLTRSLCMSTSSLSSSS